MTILGFVGLTLFLGLGLSWGLADLARGIAPNPWATVGIYFIVAHGAVALLRLPVGLWHERREREYGLSVRSWASWGWDEAKGYLLSLGFGLLAVEAFFWAVRNFPQWWWLVVWALALMVTFIMGYIGPIILFPLFYRFKPLDDGDLVARLRALAERAGAPVIGVYRMEAGVKTRRATGALAGLGRTRRIIVSDTLLEDYAPDEAEAVLAHELGHHVHGDGLRSTVFNAVIGLGLLALVYVLLGRLSAYLRLEPSDVAVLPLVLLLVGLLQLALSPLGNYLSRRREAAADLFAVRLTGKPEAFASSMVKIHDRNLSDATPHPLVEALFYTHPAGRHRVEAALRVAAAPTGKGQQV